MEESHLDNIKLIVDILHDKPELKKSLLFLLIKYNDMKEEIINFVNAEPYSSESAESNEEELEYEVDDKGFHKLK